MASSMIASSIPIFQRIPLEVWEVIFEILLDGLSSVRPLLPDSDIHALTVWMPGPDPGARPPCVPYLCGYTRNGTRSGQAYACSYSQHFERRGVHALMLVNKTLRSYLESYKPYLVDNRFIDAACRAHDYPVKSPDLICNRGLCGCAMKAAEFLLREQLFLSSVDDDDGDATGGIRRIQLTFPSIDERHAQSSSTTFMKVFRQYGAPTLEELELRSDGSYASPEDTVILPSTSIRKLIMLNTKFMVIGESLTDLGLAAENNHCTWRHSDICRVLRDCPSLERVQLLTVFDPATGRNAFYGEAPITLKSLERLHVRAGGEVCGGLMKLITAPLLTHFHVDIVDIVSRGLAQSRGDFGWDIWHCVLDVASLFPEVLRSTESLALLLHCQHDMNEDLGGTIMPQNWPEFMRLCVRLPTNGDVNRDPPSFTVTARFLNNGTPLNRAFLAPERSPGYFYTEFFDKTLDALRHRTRNPVTNVNDVNYARFTEVVLSGDAAMPSAIEWADLLRDVYNIKRLYAHGIDGEGPGLERLVKGLSHLFMEDVTGAGGGRVQEPFLVADQLEEVHLPDWDFGREGIPQDLAAIPAREFAFCPIAWSG